MTPVKSPIVSIGMPVFNGEKYLRQAIESLLSQKFRDFELIISDNASSDSTAEICAEYARDDERVKIYTQDINIGAIENFHYVLTQATGRYFMWAAADDVWDECWLEFLVGDIKDKDFAVVGAIDYIDADGKYFKSVFPMSYSENNWKAFILEADVGAVFYCYGLIHKNLAVANFEAFRRGLWADILFVYSGIFVGGVRCIPDARLKYRVHVDSVSAGLGRLSNWQRFLSLFLVNGFGYYKGFFDLTPRGNKVAVFFVILARWQKDQFRYYRSLAARVGERFRSY